MDCFYDVYYVETYLLIWHLRIERYLPLLCFTRSQMDSFELEYVEPSFESSLLSLLLIFLLRMKLFFILMSLSG